MVDHIHAWIERERVHALWKRRENAVTRRAYRACGRVRIFRFQLCGLIHDMGKIMFLWGKPEDGQQGTATGPQWVSASTPHGVVIPSHSLPTFC